MINYGVQSLVSGQGHAHDFSPPLLITNTLPPYKIGVLYCVLSMFEALAQRLAETPSLVFLYQTRTILRRCPQYRLNVRQFHQTTRRLTQSQDQEQGNDFSNDCPSFLKSKAGAVPAKLRTRKKRSSITPAEHQVFSNIFNEIASEAPSQKGDASVEQKEKEAENHKAIIDIFFSAVSQGDAEHERLAKQEAVRQTRKQLGPQIEAQVQKYPKPLQSRARRATLSAAAASIPLQIQAVSNGSDTSSAVSRDGAVTLPDLQVEPIRQRHLFENNRPSFPTAQSDVSRPAFLTAQKRDDAIASFAAHYAVFRPSFIARAENRERAKENLRRDPEEMFHRLINHYGTKKVAELDERFKEAIVNNKMDGDYRIWSICLKSISPMVKQLEESLKVTGTKKTRPARNKAEEGDTAAAITTEQETTQPASISGHLAETTTASAPPSTDPELTPPPGPVLPDLPPFIPPLYIISRLYPASLLLALRYLMTHYPSSPLSLALLPQIRALGPTSYVLGASVHFYNLLLRHTWDTYSDLRGMDGLLSEMARNGIEFDTGTWEVLEEVGHSRLAAFEGPAATAAERRKEWWERGEQRWGFERWKAWRTVVTRMLRERGLVIRVAEENGSEEGRDENGGTQTIWL